MEKDLKDAEARENEKHQNANGKKGKTKADDVKGEEIDDAFSQVSATD